MFSGIKETEIDGVYLLTSEKLFYKKNNDFLGLGIVIVADKRNTSSSKYLNNNYLSILNDAYLKLVPNEERGNVNTIFPFDYMFRSQSGLYDYILIEINGIEYFFIELIKESGYDYTTFMLGIPKDVNEEIVYVYNLKSDRLCVLDNYDIFKGALDVDGLDYANLSESLSFNYLLWDKDTTKCGVTYLVKDLSKCVNKLGDVARYSLGDTSINFNFITSDSANKNYTLGYRFSKEDGTVELGIGVIDLNIGMYYVNYSLFLSLDTGNVYIVKDRTLDIVEEYLLGNIGSDILNCNSINIELSINLKKDKFSYTLGVSNDSVKNKIKGTINK